MGRSKSRSKGKSNFSIPTAIVFLIVAFLAYLVKQEGASQPTVPPGDYQFCFWNVENFFDDVDDQRNSIDDPYDNWFAQVPVDYQLKLQKLTSVLLSMNNQRGPDVIALAEVETKRAAEALKDALNAKLSPDVPPYREVLMEEVALGRHIGTAIITRLPAIRNKTRHYDSSRNAKMRITEGHLLLNDKELIVVAAHWTSRTNGGEEGRARYADAIYGNVKAMYMNNPKVDVLVCGDFNDTPDDASLVNHLRATGDINRVRQSGNNLALYNLMAGRNANLFGTLYYRGWYIFDQIVVSPGMLDDHGWACDPNSVHVMKSLTRSDDREKRPWRFGDRTDPSASRGYSDHFPVTVTLTLDKAATKSGNN